VKSLADKLNIIMPPETEAGATLVTYKRALTSCFEGFAVQTSNLAVSKSMFEDKLRQGPFEGKSFDPLEKNTWMNYINYEKNVPMSSHPNILYIIEKAATCLCTCPEIWRELVEYLENTVGDRQYLLASLHNYRKMLRNIE